MRERRLSKYLRGSVWWVKGHRPDNDEYIRESLGTSDPELAEAKIEEINRAARKRRLLGPDAPKPEDELTFAACVLLKDVSAKEAAALKPIVRKIGSVRVKEMTPQFIRDLGKKLLPYASADTWWRQVVTPIRSIINNAHDLGKCAPIRVKAYSKNEVMQQDRFRGKDSRVPKTPGSWPWLLAFMETADPRDAALAYFMFRHGYRVSQSTAMTRSRDMDLSAGRVRIHAAKGHPAHWVELDPEEVAMIANLTPPRGGRGTEALDRVFYITSKSGGLYRRWRSACKRAGIEYLPPHSSGRHGFGTEMIVRQRVDPATASKGRWSNPGVMLKTYAHPEDSEATIRAAFQAGKEAARTPAVQRKSGATAKSMVSNEK